MNFNAHNYRFVPVDDVRFDDIASFNTVIINKEDQYGVICQPLHSGGKKFIDFMEQTKHLRFVKEHHGVFMFSRADPRLCA